MRTQSHPPLPVLGALNLDLCGTTASALRLHDSNPGSVRLSAGGVGHNIARHLARAGQAVELVTVLGRDDAAALLEQSCRRNGIGLRHALRLEEASSAYLCIHDGDGDLVAAVNDMAILDAFTPARLAAILPAFAGAPLLVTDANLPQETLEWLCDHAPAPLLLDPVSTFKAARVARCVGRFAAIKPNRLEAEFLTGEADPANAARWLLQRGVRQVFISLGVEGIYYADSGAQGLLPATPMRITNANGAGDATAAGIALGMLQGLSAEGCARLGIETVTNHLLSQGGTLL